MRSGKTERLEAAEVGRAAELLRSGGMVAFPTETVYGLGANALDAEAVAGIFAAKERPSWDPLIVHVSSRAMLERVALISERAGRLIKVFWPGPLTLLLERRTEIPDAVTAGRNLVGVRMPAHPLALALIEAAGVPVAAPSANRFGRTSPTTAAHVLEDLDGRIDAVLDGGATTVGVESTVIDPNQTPMMIYRPGAVTAAMLESVAGAVLLYEARETAFEPQSLPSPGVGMRHYAPRARLVLVRSEAELQTKLQQLAQGGDRIGVMLPQGWEVEDSGVKVFAWSSFENTSGLAQGLFAGLRELDRRGVKTILCPVPPGEGLGAAVRDRLEKAARSV